MAEAYRACTRLARRHYENFPVASWLVPSRMRPHISAIYAFARTADDLADEGDRSAGERHALLDAWRARLHAAVAGDPGNDTEAPLFLALAHTIRTCNLSTVLFDDLISAFRQDVTTGRYPTWESVLDYCRRSANPVGRLVLRVAGHDDERLDEASDAVCTALQFANFWQDLAIDWRRGRLYVPLSEIERHGASLQTLDAGHLTPEWRATLSSAVARTRALFHDGRSICDGVDGRLGWELRFTWLGGVRVLDRIERDGFDVLSKRPALGWRDAAPIVWQALRWKSR